MGRGGFAASTRRSELQVLNAVFACLCQPAHALPERLQEPRASTCFGGHSDHALLLLPETDVVFEGQEVKKQLQKGEDNNVRGVPVSPQRAPMPQGRPASHTPAGVFAGGGGDAYSPQDLPLPPLRPRAHARSETRSDEKRYFPAQSRRARLGWHWSPGTRSRLRDSPPRPAGSPLPGRSPARPSRGMALLCQAEACGKSDLHRGLFNGASTTPGPTQQNRFTAALPSR